MPLIGLIVVRFLEGKVTVLNHYIWDVEFPVQLLAYVPDPSVVPEEVETFRTDSLNIQSEPAKVLTPDGELLGLTPIEVRCLPKAIEVICSK